MAQSSKPELDLSAVDETMWLVKLPPQLAALWENKRYGEVLGKMTVGRTPQGQQQFSIKLSDTSAQAVSDYALESLASLPNMYAFSQDEERFAVEGKVTKNCWLKPLARERYGVSLRQRSVQEIASMNQTKELVGLAGQPEAATQPIKLLQSAVKRKGDEEAEPEAKTKRGRASAGGDERAVRDAVLASFNKTSRLKLKQLIAGTLHPEKSIKSVLDHYAIFHRKGPYRGYYELKPEYQAAAGAATSSTAAQPK